MIRLPERDNLLTLKRQYGVRGDVYARDTAGDQDVSVVAPLTYARIGSKDINARQRLTGFRMLIGYFPVEP